jgi:hypothetical protein
VLLILSAVYAVFLMLSVTCADCHLCSVAYAEFMQSIAYAESFMQCRYGECRVVSPTPT